MNTTVHNLKARGAAFSLPNLTRVEEGTGGTGVALCSCGWYSIPQSSGRMRKVAHALHKADVASYQGDENLLDEDGLPFSGPLLPETDPVVDKLIADGHVEIKDGEQVATEDSVIEYKNVELTDEQAASQLAAYASAGTSVSFDVGPISQEAFDVVHGVEKTVTYDWFGNYSIVFAPATKELAEAFGGISVEQKNISAVHREVHLTGNPARVEEFVKVLNNASRDALDSLRVWQKANRADRRGLTDMQKFLQHRAFLSRFITSRADELRS